MLPQAAHKLNAVIRVKSWFGGRGESERDGLQVATRVEKTGDVGVGQMRQNCRCRCRSRRCRRLLAENRVHSSRYTSVDKSMG